MPKVAGQPNQLFDTPLAVRSQVSVMNLPSLSISGVRQLPVVSLSSALLTMLTAQCLPNTMPKM